jgi:hypothetical protein
MGEPKDPKINHFNALGSLRRTPKTGYLKNWKEVSFFWPLMKKRNGLFLTRGMVRAINYSNSLFL